MPSPPGSIIRARLYVLPNGDVLVAETNAPPKPDDGKGIKGWIMTDRCMKWAGAGVPSANRITLLRDADGDGVAETKSVFLEGLNSPFGMALVGNDFYVADSDAILKFPYHDGDTKITAPGVKLADLPAGTINHHWTKNLTASPDGTQALCDRRLQQQCRRKRHRGREGSRRRARSRSRHRHMARVRVRPAQSERPVVAAAERRAVGRRQRARRTRQRSGARLHDLGEGRRVLRLAVQLLRPACRHARRSRNGPIWWRRPSRPITRWARIRPRSG